MEEKSCLWCSTPITGAVYRCEQCSRIYGEQCAKNLNYRCGLALPEEPEEEDEIKPCGGVLVEQNSGMGA